MPKGSKGKKRVSRRPRRRLNRRIPRQGGLTRIIKYIVGQNIETKSAQAYWDGALTSRASAVFGERCVGYLCPAGDAGYPAGQQISISQGAGDGQRISNKITTKSVSFKFNIYVAPYNASSNPNPKPYLVTLWIFKLANDAQESRSDAANMMVSNMFDLGNTATSIQNNLTDHIRPYNNNVVRVLRKMTFKVGHSEYAGTGSAPASQNFTSNDYKLNIIKYLNVTKYVNKTFRFEDTSTDPTTKKTFFAFTFAPADGSSGAFLDPFAPVRVSWYVDYKYKDA